MIPFQGKRVVLTNNINRKLRNKGTSFEIINIKEMNVYSNSVDVFQFGDNGDVSKSDITDSASSILNFEGNFGPSDYSATTTSASAVNSKSAKAFTEAAAIKSKSAKAGTGIAKSAKGGGGEANMSAEPSSSPTSAAASAQPSVSAKPSSSPSVSLQPSVSAGPSTSPSISLQPSVSAQPSVSLQPTSSRPPSVQPSVSTKPSGSPSVSLQPSVSAEPSDSPSISLQPSVSAQPSNDVPDIGYPNDGTSRIYVKIENYSDLTEAELTASVFYGIERGFQTYPFPLSVVLAEYPLTGTPSGFYIDFRMPYDICMDWYFVTPSNAIKLTAIMNSAPGLGPNFVFQLTGPCTGTNNYCGPWVNSGITCPPLANPFMPSDITDSALSMLNVEGNFGPSDYSTMTASASKVSSK